MSAKNASRSEIEEFLEEFRALCRPKVNFEPRPEYFKFLAKNNLVEKDANQVVLEEINNSHYVSGPDDDYNPMQYPGPVLKFKIYKFGTTIYIKLKMYPGKMGRPSAKCLSFHDDENVF